MTAAQRVAMHLGNRRLRKQPRLRPDSVKLPSPRSQPVRVFGQLSAFLEVAPRAERTASTSIDKDDNIRIIRRLSGRRVYLTREADIQCVEHLRAVEGDARDAVLRLVEQEEFI